MLCFTVFRTHPGPEVGAIPARPILLPSLRGSQTGTLETGTLSFSPKRNTHFSEDWLVTFFCQRGPVFSSLSLPEWRRSRDFLQILKVPVCKVPVCELLLPSVPHRIGPGRAETDFLAISLRTVTSLNKESRLLHFPFP